MDLIVDLAGRQHGVVGRCQLLEAGVDRWTVGRLVSRRYLRPRHRGVYQVGAAVGVLAREMAAVLACGPGAVVSHVSAASMWKLIVALPPGSPVEVSVPGLDRSGRPGIVAHRLRALARREVTTLDGVPVTTPARTILDLAARLTSRDLERAITRGEREEVVGREDLAAVVRRHPRRPGTPVLAGLLGLERSLVFTRSEAEERFLAAVVEAQLPRPKVNSRVCGLEVDFWWAAERFVVEVDGRAFHGSTAASERDRLRDARLTAAGIRVMRVTWEELTTKKSALIARVAQALVVR
jgi:very-short-patch-repair endonuclease